jgi:hypothetical protein
LGIIPLPCIYYNNVFGKKQDLDFENSDMIRKKNPGFDLIFRHAIVEIFEDQILDTKTNSKLQAIQATHVSAKESQITRCTMKMS